MTRTDASARAAILGIDPSLSATGIATPTLSGTPSRTGAHDPNRLAVIYTAVRVQATTPQADLAVIEDLHDPCARRRPDRHWRRG